MFYSNITSSVNLSLPCRLISLSAVEYQLVHMFIPLVHYLSQSEVSYVHCAMTLLVEYEFFGDRIGVLFIFEPLACRIGLTKNKCTELVQAPKRVLGVGAGVLFSFVTDAMGKTVG